MLTDSPHVYTVQFPSDRQFSEFRKLLAEKRFAGVAEISRLQIRPDGTRAKLVVARGLGAEVRGVGFMSYGMDTLLD